VNTLENAHQKQSDRKLSLFRGKKSAPSDGIDELFDRVYGFYTEAYFRELLVLERKRTERSKKPFLLMLIDISKLADESERKTVRKVMSVMNRTSRDTDLKGWFKQDSILGVIFTEFSPESRDHIQTKVNIALAGELDTQRLKKVDVRGFVFPEEQAAGDDVTPVTELGLYGPQAGNAASRISMALKRGIDILGSLTAIMLFSPLFIIIAALIKLTSKGPVFFKQERVGIGGQNFKLLKFRSMHVNNDASIHQQYIKEFIKNNKENAEGDTKVFKIQNDPRVTWIGKWIRKTSLDELPQFFNVLFGAMSLVGPRPPIRYELEEYDLWHLRRVLEVKPGITGLWQVEGRSLTTFDGMCRMDIEYIRTQSVLLDLKLLFKTPWAVITAKGAY
jgi:lipopolysaccharide/colanic/teichoic acid biosynthesis glycosyltransferase